MRILLNFKCEHCGEELELLQHRDEPAPHCSHGHGAMQKVFATPAFTFKNGKGTSGGHTWRIATPKK
ncbi:hypothetical protein WG922_07695 [Ramlibacter sp. AN1015]|uniref:FmdB family zinc ribbon protein n=1 Tax=Ramlibacter sp. AN1015 TaxID=3133428 RepID=UPI0030BC5814